jgi:enoyl-CoA hydratase/carnithine racemase
MLGLMSSAPILMEGRMFSAQKAKAIGLIDKVSNPLDLINEAKKLDFKCKERRYNKALG